MQTNNCGNKLKPSKSYRDSEDAAAKEGVGNESEFKSKVFYSEEKKRSLDSSSFIRGSSNSNSSTFPTIVVCQRESKPLGRSRGRSRDDFRMARGGSVAERRGGGGNGISGSSTNVRGRGAGGMSRKATEREVDSGVGGFLPRGKFQESLSKSSSSDVLSSGSSNLSKNVNEMEGNKGRSDSYFMLPDDARISKLLRRLNREDDPEKCISITKQLQEAFQNSENGRYIRRSVDLIADSLLEVLRRGPGSDARQQAARCLGRFGYALESDFKRFSEWLFNKYSTERGEEVRRLLMVALLETLKVDARSGGDGESKGDGSLVKLKDFSGHLMSQLQTALENTCLPELLVATVDVLLFLAKLCPVPFTKHFRDTVDILVGWHIDGGQPHWVCTYASQTLRKLRPFWLNDLGFSVNLLAQFIEDVEAFGEDLLQSESGRSSPEDKPPSSPEDLVFRITQLIKVFNTVVRSLGEGLTPAVPPAPQSPVTWPFLVDGLQKVLKAVHSALSTPPASHQNYEDLLVSANECACLLLSLLHSRMGTSVLESLKTFLFSQIALTPSLSHSARVSMLGTIAKTVREVSSNLPPELVPALISPILPEASPLLELRFSASCPGHLDCPCRSATSESKGVGGEGEMLLVVHHALLSLKNVPLLQEAYRYVLMELEAAYMKLVPSASLLSTTSVSSDVEPIVNGEDDDDIQSEKAQIIVLYQLRALSDLANASNSIIGMWALKPSILELLAVRMRCYNPRLAVKWPHIQHAILYLLRSHCQRYNHFVSSSSLVGAGAGGSVIGGPTEVGGLVVPSGSSPTSGHLTTILQLLAKILNEPETGEPTRLLVLHWSREVIAQCNPYLYGKNGSVWHGHGTEFVDFVWALVLSGRTHKRHTAQAVLAAMATLLDANSSSVKFSGESWCSKVLPEEMVPYIVDMCLQHLDWPEPELVKLQPLLLGILPHLPWPVALPVLLSRLTAAAPSRILSSNDVGALIQNSVSPQKDCNRVTVNGSDMPDLTDNSLHKLKKNDSRQLCMRTVKTWRSIMCDGACRGTFGGEMHPTHFRPFMAYLLQGIQHSDKNWLLQAFASCWPLQHGQGSFEGNLRNSIVAALTGKKRVEGRLEDQSLALELALSSEAALLSWAAHQAAHLCVRMKLRTPLGKPQDTFTSIESAIKNIAREGPHVLITQPRSESNDQTPRGGTRKWLMRTQPLARRAMVLLDFLEQLEKAAYNAWEGSAVSMAPPPKPVRMFFRTNKSTCAEWLGRIRWASMTVAVQRTTHGAPAHALRHGQMMLSALAEAANTRSSEFERCVLYVAWSLCMLGEPEAIVGLQAWCNSVVNSSVEEEDISTGMKFSWLEAISHQAAGRYEAALREYMAVIDESENFECDEGKSEHIDSHVMAFIHKQVEECYCSLQAWNAAMLWCEKDTHMVDNHCGWLYERKSRAVLKILSNFPSSMKSSDSESKISIDEDKDDRGSDEESAFEDSIWEKYGLNDGIIGSASSTVARVESVLQGIALMIAKEGTKITDAVKLPLMGEVEGCEKALQIHLREGLFSSPSNFLPEVCVLQFAASGLRSVLEGKSGTYLFDLSGSDVLDPGLGSSLLLRLLWWSHFFSADLENDAVISRLRICASKAARWEGNFNLCEKLLEKEMKVRSGKEVYILENLNVTAEHAKFLQYTGSHVDAINLASKTCLEICKVFSEKPTSESSAVREKCSRLLLSLSKWIRPAPSASDDPDSLLSSPDYVTSSPSLLELLNWEKSSSSLSLDTTPPGFEQLAVDSSWKSGEMSESAEALPSLIRLGISICPGLAKAWATLGGWCYDMGRKTVEEISMPTAASGNNIPMWLSDKEMVAAQNIFMPVLRTNMEILEACEYLLQKISEEECEVNDVVSNLVSEFSSLSLEGADNQLLESASSDDNQEVPDSSSPKKYLSTLNEQQLLELWTLIQSALKRRYVHYEMAVAAYFRYLHLSGGDEEVKSKESVMNGSDATTRLTASLRLLRLVSSPLRAHIRLRPYLEHGVASTPVAPWVPLLPQLLSRLGHASTPPYARRALSGLLCRLPQHLVAFPAVVGATADSLTKAPGLRQPSGPKSGLRGKRNSIPENRDVATSEMFEESQSEVGDGNDAEMANEEKERADEDEMAEEEKAMERGEGGGVDEEDEDDEDDEDEEDEEDGSVGEMQASVMKNCFQSIVDTLAKKNPECVAGVQTLVKELRRTTLLWDEAWLGLLAQQSTEAARRCSQAEAEAARTYANPRIIDPTVRDKIILEKHRIIVAPVLWALEQLYSLTCVVPPETPHERRFRDRHGPLLTELLSRMRQPPDPRHPNESWLTLYHRIQASLRGGSSSGPPSLRMSEVSPVLAAMRGTAVAMPGANNSTGNVITIEGVHEHVTILPTKTRPKKLVFYGSDGQKYTYLFKGLEDLHLDERIMQFLSVANTMMARASRKYSNLDVVSRGGGGWKDRGSLYRARHYSVTPLGPRAGLISWVEGATPLFGLYKRWQHRQAAASAAAAAAAAAKPPGIQSSSGQASVSSKSGGGNSGAPTGILRPSELFHSKLAPLLKERGIPVPVAPGPHGGGGYVPADGRRDWPPQVLRQVLSQLMEETPKDLLAKELWCRSANASAWWQATRTYAHSVAVMSIIGYVIGLGDRHLDNVLVDLETGEVVHIDYNVCFEKGRTLRVPEKVPFRMTPNLETALGVTGIEGTFRLACEHVLQTLQNGSETLLTLLEAFVYDPLVDWTPGNEVGYAGSVYGGGWSHRRPQGSTMLEGRQSRKEMEKELTKSMFIVRVQEMRNEWFANQDDLKDLLPQAKVQLEAWEAARSSYRSRAHTLQGWHHVLAALKDAEANCLMLTASEDVESKENVGGASGNGSSNQEKAMMVDGAAASSSGEGENAVEKAKEGLTEAIQEWEAQEKLHQAALSSLFGPQLSLWMQEMQSFSIKEREGDEKSREAFDLVRGLLQTLGAGQTVAQCDQSRADLWNVRCRRMMLVHGCLDLLGQYSTLASFFPRSNSRSTPHRPICYARWANELLQDFTVETCHRLHSLASSLLMNPSNMSSDLAAVLSYRRSLQASIAHSASYLEKVCVRLRAEKLDEADGNMTMTPLQACEDSRNAVMRFIAAEGGLLRGGAAIQCVVLTALARLNRQFLSMESAAASAIGESLSTLCSREGDWFLDEMCNIITTVTEISSVVDMDGAWGGDIGGVGMATNVEDDIPQLRDALQCLHTAYGIFKALQDLNFNVRTIILPEALKSVIGEEPSVLMMMGLLDILERNLGTDLNHHFGPDIDMSRSPTKRLLSVLETHLQFVAIGAESPHSAAPAIAERMCRQFEEILRSDEEIVGSSREQDGGGIGGHGNMSPGQMLLMGFNGLFEKVQREGCVLADSLPSILPPRGWVEAVDHLIESEALLAPMLRTETRDTQETLLHAQRVNAIREFFSLCQSAADAFRSEGSSSVSEVEQDNEEERICMPVKHFTANAVQGLLLGSITRSISMAICITIHKSLGINVNETIKDMISINSENFSGSLKRVSLDDLCRNAVEVCCKRDAQGLQPSAPTQLSTSPLLSPSAMLALPIGSPDAANSARIQAGCLPGVASSGILPINSGSIEAISHHELTPPPMDPAVLLAYTSEPHPSSSMVGATLAPFPTLPNMTGDVEVDASHSRTVEELSRGDGMRLFSVLPVPNVMNKRVVSLLPSFPLSLLPVASTLLCTFQAHCSHLALQRRLLRDAEWARLSLQRLRLQAAAHAWIHGSEEDGIDSQIDTMAVNILSRPRFLNELRDCVSALSAIEPCVMEASENYSASANEAIQRLKWEHDSNPAFEEVISSFERELACSANELSREGSLSALLGSVGAALLHREGLRSGCLPVAPEAEAADSAFIRILNECETSITSHQQKILKLTSSGDVLASSVKPDMAALCKITDPSLLQITPENFKDTNSIRAFEVHIAERIRGVQVEMGEAQVAMEAADDGVRRCASKIRSLLATHHRLMSDVRSLLKTMLKFEDMASTGLDAFLRLYRSYSESFASLLRTLLAPPGTAPPQDSPTAKGGGAGDSGGGAAGSRACNDVDGSDGEDGEVMGGRADARRKRHALEQLHSLEAMTGRIYSGLVDLAAQMGQSGSGQPAECLLKTSKSKSGRPKLVRQDGVCQSPVKVTGANASRVAPSPRAAKGGVNSVGERNAYALSVWKRVKMKLEGRDPSPSKKSSIAEQVDYVIQEATSLDNLSLLYEGWTPWV